MAIKPIETNYRGFRFRSRIEARWAVFFDALGIKWEYEKEGYDLGEAGWYLPDFWLPQVDMWAEVKSKAFSDVEVAKCIALATSTEYPCLMLDGAPEPTNYWGVVYLGIDYGIDFVDYVMGESHMHHLRDGYFYSNTGDGKYPRHDDFSGTPNLVGAVNASRGARFEHGENGPVKVDKSLSQPFRMKVPWFGRRAQS